MNSVIKKRFPIFAVGLLLGTLLSYVYWTQRQKFSATEPLTTLTVPLEQVLAPMADLRAIFTLPEAWNWNEQYKSQATLFAVTGNSSAKFLSLWRLEAQKEQELQLPPLEVGPYLLRVDFYLCAKEIKDPKQKPCIGQTLQFRFDVKEKAQERFLRLSLEPRR